MPTAATITRSSAGQNSSKITHSFAGRGYLIKALAQRPAQLPLLVASTRARDRGPIVSLGDEFDHAHALSPLPRPPHLAVRSQAASASKCRRRCMCLGLGWWRLAAAEDRAEQLTECAERLHFLGRQGHRQALLAPPR